MKIDFSKELIGYDGEPLREGEKVLTLSIICCNALMNQTEEDTKLPGEEKLRRFDLATIIYASREATDLKVEDVSLLKTLIGKLYGPIVVGPCWKLLEGE